jgi:uncharacterized protein YerC
VIVCQDDFLSTDNFQAKIEMKTTMSTASTISRVRRAVGGDLVK